ncbi:MAG: head GIN domain-containing protein [Acidimicrobiia bacterium]
MTAKAATSLILVAVVVTGCTAVTGSGDVITIDVPIEGVSRLLVSHSFEVNVAVGEQPSLTLRVDDNLEANLSVGLDGDTLRIGLEPRTGVSNATLEADLTVTSLEAIEGSGAVDIHLAILTGSDFDLQLSGASELDGTLEFGSMTGEISGASNLSLSGQVGTVDIGASGASDLALLELEVDDLRIRLSGASDAEITVNDSIEASLSGASSLRYRGDPEVNTLDVSGASSIGKVTEPG